MTPCPVCLAPGSESREEYHSKCLKLLFGLARLPTLALDMAHLHTAGLEIAGKVAISGVQRKVSLRLSSDGTALETAAERGTFILKPPPATFPAVPENEHLTLKLAALVGIDVPPCGLIRMKDDTLAFLTVRFDRTATGRKRRQEDFCQLSARPSSERYDGSSEQCATTVKRFASEPGIELIKLYRLLVFSWWVGNGDLHLKNLSLLCGDDGRHRLSPAYDLLNTRIILGDEELALPVQGKKRNLTRRTWLDFASHVNLPEKASVRVLLDIGKRLEDALELVRRSFLPADQQAAYEETLRARAVALT